MTTTNSSFSKLNVGKLPESEFEREDELQHYLASIENIVATIKSKIDLIHRQANQSEASYMGTPTEAHLKIIHLYTNDSSSVAEDWFVCCVRASDNLVNGSSRKWSINILNQMRDRSNGTSFLLDHNWDSIEDAIGFIFDGYVEKSDLVPSSQVPGFEDWNRKIIDKEGYVTYNTWVAIPVNQEIVEMVKNRRAQFASTGGLMKSMKYICPLCTEEKGREVDFYEKDKNGDWVCPHQLPGMAWLYDVEDEGLEMPYVLIDGQYLPVEVSFVTAGNLPNAQVIR